VPLRLGDTVIGMIGVANKQVGYDPGDQRLLTTFAGQVAVAVDNARLYERQRQMIAELQQLRERLTEAERAQLLGRERERIAGALHDRIQQEIFMIGVRLNALLKDGAVEPRLAQELQELRQLSVDAADEVRRAIFSVTGPELQGSLTDNIRSLLQELERSSDIRVHLSVTGTPNPAEETVHDVVHLVVNEALTNVNRHANATVVLVNLRYEPDRIDVVIQDDGVGAPQLLLDTFQDSYLHFGLRHICQAVIDRGGTFTLANGEEAGLVLRVSMPLSAKQP
jgi:signal transduction histidine kinase